MDRFRRLAVGTVAATYVLVVVGGIVRATGSGLGCPDWPRCHGSWIPPLERTALIEYAHRSVAAVVGLLVAALVVVAWRKRRRFPRTFGWSVGALGLVLVQAWLGRVVVLAELRPLLVTAHLAAAMALLAVLIYLAVIPEGADEAADRGLVERLWLGAWAVYGLILVGALVRGAGATLVFPDWPLMDGRLVPVLDSPARLYHFFHRLAALSVGAYLGYLVVHLRRRAPDRPELSRMAGWLLALFAVQALVGASAIWFRVHPATVVLHVSLAALIWGLAFFLALAATRTGAAGQARAYLALTKPRIVELLLITTVPAMVLAAGGWPGTPLVVVTLVGGTLSAAGANTINNYLDRDIDRVMGRTAKRPLPTRRVEPRAALVFGVTLGAAGFGWLWWLVNPPAALLATGALLFYIFVYTAFLKRSPVQNIVIGGAAGAAPVLVGWAAVTGTIGWAAVVMFAIVFSWTPPHFWALALRHRDDYRRAGVPMLPVVRGVADTTRQILAYSVVLVAVTLLLWPVAGLGALYAGAASVLGAVFVWQAWRLLREPWRAMALFRYSIVYLALLFVAIGVDVIL